MHDHQFVLETKERLMDISWEPTVSATLGQERRNFRQITPFVYKPEMTGEVL